jgi:NADH:ubiquinone oxidoreductase subunit 2 (subunit N)
MLLILVAALLLPGVFPLSMLFGALAGVARTNAWRLLVVAALPAAGVLLLGLATPPRAAQALLQAVLLASALLYAWRLLGVRELFVWARLQAASAGALVWLAWLHGSHGASLYAAAAALLAPALLLSLLAAAMQRRVGAAYAGLRGSIAAAYPRLGAALAVCLLAVLALPPFPGFLALLGLLRQLGAAAAGVVLLVWLLWSWAGAMLWQGTQFGPAWPATRVPDLARGQLLGLALAAGMFVLGGLLWSGTWSTF